MSETFDIVVVGSGSAGIAAAATAVRSGCRTLLLDSADDIGGTGGRSGLTTLCGLYDSNGQFLNRGFSREFAEALAESAPIRMGRVWVLPYRPERFVAIAKEYLKGVSLHCHTPLNDVRLKNGKIEEINGIACGAVIDCSGTAEVARLAGLKCRETDDRTQAAAVIFELANVTGDLRSTAAMARVLLPLARAGFAPVNFQPNLEPGSVTVKFSGLPGQVADLVEFLRRNVSGFEKVEMTSVAPVVARRSGRMIEGRSCLTGADVLEGRRFADGVARCAWPVEQWGPEGTPKFQYLPDGVFYEIPAGCLQSAAVDNLFMGGKTISADEAAIASARVMGCCLATGTAAAQLAAGKGVSRNSVCG